MKVYKENSFLIFDFEDGKTVKYDFATKKSYGFSGKEVNGLQNQLRNISFSQIKESCTDENYANFLEFVKRKETYYIYNIGTILNRVSKYSRFEQIFSAGIKDVDSRFKYRIGDIPCALRKLCIKKDFKISNFVVESYIQNPDAMFLVSNLSYMSLDNRKLYSILFYPYYRYDSEEKSNFNILTKQMGYSAKPLLQYIDQLVTFEAIDDVGLL